VDRVGAPVASCAEPCSLSNERDLTSLGADEFLALAFKAGLRPDSVAWMDAFNALEPEKKGCTGVISGTAFVALVMDDLVRHCNLTSGGLQQLLRVLSVQGSVRQNELPELPESSTSPEPREVPDLSGGSQGKELVTCGQTVDSVTETQMDSNEERASVPSEISAGTLDSSSVTVSQMLSPACQATDTALAGANTATALSRTEEPVSKERAEAPQRKRSISPPQELDSKTSGTTPLSWPAPARHQATTDVSMLTRSVHRELDSLAHSVQGDGRSKPAEKSRRQPGGKRGAAPCKPKPSGFDPIPARPGSVWTTNWAAELEGLNVETT